MIQTRLIQKLATGQVLFKDEAGKIIQTRIDSEPIGLTGELYPESITVGEGENTYSFVTPSNGGITLQPVSGSPTVFTGNAQALLVELTADFFTNTLGSGGGSGGDASAALQQQQLDEAVYQTQFQGAILDSVGSETDSPATNPSGSASQIALQKGILANGFKSDIFELVIDPITGIQYLKSVVLDPNTPPIEFKYYDPVTGLVATTPTNPTYPVISSLGVGNVTDAPETNPANDASAIALLKGIVSNTAPAPTPSNHQRNSQVTNSVLVKSGPGKILSGAFTNKTTGTKYLRIYSFNSTPAPTLTPLFEVAALTGTTVPIPQINGFVLGIAYIISSSANQTGAQLTVADAASVQLSYI